VRMLKCLRLLNVRCRVSKRVPNRGQFFILSVDKNANFDQIAWEVPVLLKDARIEPSGLALWYGTVPV
jgi:hypothetical protein